MRSQTYTFRVMIEPDTPSGLPRLRAAAQGSPHTHGDTLEEVKRNLREAIICHLQGLLKDEEPIPEEGEMLELIQSVSLAELAGRR